MEFYSEALKAGLKYYKQSVSKGEYPYLPALDEIISESIRSTGIDAGLIEIPTKLIVGTKTQGRTRSFAGNYMPILEEQSEFAGKWKNLCKSHLEEGIRDPIQVWEYMNRFYVQEGNKRVSVLKYFGAPAIPAIVRRVLPKHTGDPDVERYYEFLNFCEVTGINYIEFSSEGSYKELLSQINKDSGIWTEEERRDFKVLYYKFESAYFDCGGEKLRNTTADALLSYIHIFGFDSLKEESPRGLKQLILKIWDEIALQQESSRIEVKMNPQINKKINLAGFIPKKTLKAAFIYGEDIETSRWSANHDAGREHIERVFSGKIETRTYIRDSSIRDEDNILKAIRDGARVIFVTESSMINACVRVAIEHPEVDILNCSLNAPHRYVRTYYPRMYEAKFITGAVAGALTDHNKAGYICKYPVYGMIAEINAFARGLAMVNPKAKVYLEWSSVRGIREAEKSLRDQGIHLISYLDFYEQKSEMEVVFGLMDLHGIEPVPLVLPVWNWGAFYERILFEIMQGSYKREYRKTCRSLNYYWGMSAGVVDIIFSGKLPQGVRYLGESLCRAIRSDIIHPFYQAQTKENGHILWEPSDRSVHVENIITMNKLEDNVIGSIPSYSELEYGVQKLVDEIGVDVSRKKPGEQRSL